MVPVEVTLIASDACENPEDLGVVCEVTSSASDDANGDGEFTGDVDGLDGYTAPVPVDLVYDPRPRYRIAHTANSDGRNVQWSRGPYRATWHNVQTPSTRSPLYDSTPGPLMPCGHPAMVAQ
jgi:hypothetical protein